MDYKGQELAEHLYYYIIILFGSVAWILGYIWQDFQTVVIGCAAGVLVSTLLVVPDWPFFNRNPVKWLDALPDRRSGGGGLQQMQQHKQQKQQVVGRGRARVERARARSNRSLSMYLPPHTWLGWLVGRSASGGVKDALGL